MVDFSGWDMPLHYGSQIEEHRQVREKAGLFDVSHMAAVDVEGADALAFLRHLLANDAARLEAGSALYTLMLNQGGGVVDDLLAYRRDDQRYRLIINAGNRETDMAWMRAELTGFETRLERRDDMGILALQGPQAVAILAQVLPAAAPHIDRLRRFHCMETGDLMIARTGYTGEDGFELVMPVTELQPLWHALVQAGASPCGLGARDTLRLEAGLCLYGHEMDAQTSPLEAGLGWTIAWQPAERQFIGRTALEQQRKAGVAHQLIGLELLDRGVLRQGQQVWQGDHCIGEITSGSFSPVLGKSIALARLPVSVSGEVQVEMRDKRLTARLVRPPFVSSKK